MGKTAIVIGATGLTGNTLLRELLNTERYSKIHSISRRSVKQNHPKLKEHIADLFNFENTAIFSETDVVFCCIGTTKSKTPDKDQYRKIDYGIPITVAKLAKTNGIGCVVVMSSLGANKHSPVFYNRIKGEMEAELIKLGIPRTYILRPSIILGKRQEKRFGETLAKSVMTALSPILIGPLRKYRPIDVHTIASCMLYLPNSDIAPGIIESDDIITISKRWE